MNRQQKVAVRSWRWIALGTLFVWLSAFGLCTAHCALGKNAPFSAAHGQEQAPAPCHGGPTKSHPDSKTAGSFCFTIKTLYSAVSYLGFQPPDALALFQPVFAALSAAEVDLINSAQVLRQSRAPDLLFTPEVYLGPAFRIHAPPALL